MSRASAKPKDAPVRALRSLREAAKFLTGQGLKCGKSTLADAVQAGRIVRTPDGGFDPASLLRWAAASVEPGAEPDTLQRDKLVAVVRGLRAKADRLETQRDVERGDLIPVEQAHRERGIQMGLFWSLLGNLARTWPTRAVALGLPPERQPELVADLAREIADTKRKLFDAYQRGEPVLVPREEVTTP